MRRLSLVLVKAFRELSFKVGAEKTKALFPGSVQACGTGNTSHQQSVKVKLQI